MLDMTIHNEERPKIKIAAKNLNFFYGDHQSLFDNNLEIPENRITAVIGPSGCGKSTHLRIYNRIFELYREQRVEGEVIIDGQNILDRNVDVLELRRKVGMIFQRPTPFPMSVFDNVAYGMRLHFKLRKNEIAERVEAALRGASLWDEVKDKLNGSGLALSGGQQQRLCIARTIGYSSARRADFRHRPCRHAQNRGTASETAPEIYDRDRYAQYAAGVAYLGLHRLLLQGAYHRA